MDRIDRKLFDSICSFEVDEAAREYYYESMYSKTGKLKNDGNEEILKEKILRIYAALFCDDMDLPLGALAGFDEVDATADRLYIGSVGLDPEHWYRMHHHFPVIDEDNFERFAALVITDLKAGELHELLVNEGKTLVIGEADPLSMTSEQRKNQETRSVKVALKGGDD
ncbi:MAG: hypothetical protein J5929_08160 [Eubacterium sp.]|nr:hypothetical protein [Eubacterium sp.]